MQEILDILNVAKGKFEDMMLDLYLSNNPEGDNDEVARVCRYVKRRLNDIIDEIQ